MKNSLRLIILAASLTLAALPLVLTAAVTAPTTQPAPSAPHRPFLRRVAHRLGLNRDQIAQIKTLRTQEVAALKAIRADTGLTPEQKKTKAVAAVQTFRTGARNVLTHEQQTKLTRIGQRLHAWRNLAG